MVRGEVWWVNCDLSLGGEIQKIRPAVIVNNNASNRNLNRVQVVPISSKTSKLYASEALVTLNGDPRQATSDYIATVSKTRLGGRLSVLSDRDLRLVEIAIQNQLGLRLPGGSTQA